MPSGRRESDATVERSRDDRFVGRAARAAWITVMGRVDAAAAAPGAHHAVVEARERHVSSSNETSASGLNAAIR
jgi:hypothetical protein